MSVVPTCRWAAVWGQEPIGQFPPGGSTESTFGWGRRPNLNTGDSKVLCLDRVTCKTFRPRIPPSFQCTIWFPVALPCGASVTPSHPASQATCYFARHSNDRLSQRINGAVLHPSGSLGSCLATSRTSAMKSSAIGLSARFLRVTIEIGRRVAGRSIGSGRSQGCLTGDRIMKPG
jgi:hypothetical protein